MNNIIKKIKNFIERIEAVKKLVNADEYFLGVSNLHDQLDNVICYDYFHNTNRNLFYTFIHDKIENELRAITGKFICIRNFEFNNIEIKIGDIVWFERGTLIKIENKPNELFETSIPISEIFSHFHIIENK
jgi:hypothetical protein